MRSRLGSFLHTEHARSLRSHQSRYPRSLRRSRWLPRPRPNGPPQRPRWRPQHHLLRWIHSRLRFRPTHHFLQSHRSPHLSRRGHLPRVILRVRRPQFRLSPRHRSPRTARTLRPRSWLQSHHLRRLRLRAPPIHPSSRKRRPMQLQARRCQRRGPSHPLLRSPRRRQRCLRTQQRFRALASGYRLKSKRLRPYRSAAR